MTRIPFQERFWQKVARAGEDDCWNWTAALRPNGYGSFRGEKRRLWDTHRLTWVLTYGDVPDGLFVLHRCDNRACCNPRHLFLGTPLDNMRDMYAKGRNRVRLGAATGTAKLTPERVREIRRRFRQAKEDRWPTLHAAAKEFACEFGVGPTAIRSVLQGIHWGWVEDE